MDIKQLQNLFQEEMQSTSQAVMSFPWHDRDCYASYMKQTWGFSRHTCALIGGCGIRLMEVPMIQRRFFHHVVEELGHEELAQRDIESMGFDFDALPVLSVTKGFVYSQYYHVHHVSPYSFFGYILMLETLPGMCAEILPKIIAAHGFDASVFLRVHIEEDPEHSNAAWRIVENFSPEILDLVYANFVEASENYRMILQDIIASKFGKMTHRVSPEKVDAIAG